MSYSRLNPAWNRMQRGQNDARIDNELSYVRALTEACPDMSRDAIRTEAARLANSQTVVRS